MIGSPTHIKKGETMFVEPIRQREEFESIKKLLANKTRDLLLFTLGINNDLRCGETSVQDVSHALASVTATG